MGFDFIKINKGMKFITDKNGKEYCIAGGKKYRIFRDATQNKYLFFRGLIFRLTRGDEFIVDHIPVRMSKFNIKQITEAFTEEMNAPDGSPGLGLTRTSKFWNEVLNLLPGHSTKQHLLLNLQYIKNSNDWKSLWPLVKILKRFRNEYKRARKFAWGEAKGSKEKHQRKKEIVLQVIKDNEKDLKEKKVTLKVLPISTNSPLYTSFHFYS